MSETDRAHGWGAFAARIGDAVVVLDLKADRYFLALPGRSSVEATQKQADRFFFDAEASRWSAEGSRWAAGRFRIGPSLVSLACLRRISHLLQRRSFQRLVETIRAAPLSARRTGLAPEILLASYEAARPFHSRPRLCRLDAPALCLLFRRYGHPARLVFGVRLEPFAAHCWAQLERTVLSEPVEAVVQYTPILVV